MAALGPEIISRKHRKELTSLRSLSRRIPLAAFFLIGFAVVVLFVAFAMLGDRSETQRQLAAARNNLELSGLVWTQDFLDRQSSYRVWFSRHGTYFEGQLFDAVSKVLLKGAGRISAQSDSLSFPARAYRSFLFAVMRVCFLVLACWRLWLFAVLLAAVWSFFRLRPYQAGDLLGETGNARLFFSGIAAGLDEVDERGRPQKQVTGLACPAALPAMLAKSSQLGKLLGAYGALNNTNIALAGVILKHAAYPPYVAGREEQPLLEAAFSGGNLSDNCLALLQAVLELHKKYRQVDSWQDYDAKASAASSLDTPPLKTAGLDSQQYAQRLSGCMERVLTRKMKEALSELSPAQVATALLTFEAGKVLAYAYEGGRWNQRSIFPQLCARAVLHSIASFSADYTLDARSDIRRALVYGSRRSVFAPVRLPVDMSAPSSALRQWVELWMAAPHELQFGADEVELSGLIAEAHQAWRQAFFDALMIMSPEITDDLYAGPSNLLFMPLVKILALLRRVISGETARRLEALLSLVSQKERLQSLTSDLQEETQEKRVLDISSRLLAPLEFQRMQELSGLHALSLQDLKDWSTLRVILNAYAWLGRRVGDYTVPDSSIIFAVFRVNEPSAESNELGLIGKKAMVPLRATRLAERWGKSWYARFKHVDSATMAESVEDFERLMKGIQPALEEERDSDSPLAL